MENKRRARQGFTLVALMVMLAVAAVIMMSPEYIGKVRRDAEIQLTDRVTRDLAILAEAIRQDYIRHMQIRSNLVAGSGGVTASTITDLWSQWNQKDWSQDKIKALLNTFPGIGTIKFWGDGTDDLAAPPTIVRSFLNNETLSTPTGDIIIPSTISVNITVTTNRPMYAHTVRDVQNRFMKSANITNVRFDFVDKRELQITVMVGQNISRFNPLSL